MQRPVFSRSFIWPRFQSLKSRVIAILLVSTMVPILLIGTISYYTILSILDNKIRSTIANQLKQTGFFLENTLTNLNYASQQLTFEGGVGRYLENYLVENDEKNKSLYAMYIQNNIDLLRAANPNLGIGFYYLSDNNQVLLQEAALNRPFVPDRLPPLTSRNGLTYYGPHSSMDKLYDTPVFSLTRRIYLPQNRDLDVYLYIETSPKLIENLFRTEQSGLDMAFVIVNQAGQIIFSQNRQDFPLGSRYSGNAAEAVTVETNPASGYDRNSYIFEESSYQGWKVVAVIPEASYNSEKKRWLGQYALVTLLSIAIAVALAWMIWKTVYRPVTSLNHKIRSLQQSDFHSSIEFTGVTEFDSTLREFVQMRQKVWLLLKEVEQKEKKRSRLEVEKLMFQINPHFLHNTLDTIRWLARLNGQDDIERLVATLNKLLHYNMGKGGETTLQGELEALEDYVVLQKIRYDFEFKVHIQAEEQWLGMDVPRFLLQPLVENSLYHGGGDDGTVEVSVFADSERWICIEVRDNGKGMNEEELRQLVEGNPDNSRKAGLGIGLAYVNQIIKVHFGQDARLDIMSGEGAGTSMIVRLPVRGREGTA